MIQHNCEKKFHVSPFIEMNCNYFFRILKPADKISVIIDQYQLNEKILYASQDGQRKDFTTSELIKSSNFNFVLIFNLELSKFSLKIDCICLLEKDRNLTI